MEVTETFLKGCFIIEPSIYKDSRGCFFESFNYKEFKEKTGLNINFVQDNISISKRGVIRGLHKQKEPFEQAKLVYVIKGKVLDVVVDCRKKSPTFGKHFSIELSSENNKQLFIPKGFLHGFSTLVDDTIFVYKCDNFYKKGFEDGVLFNDSQLEIDWSLSDKEIILSRKDLMLKNFQTIPS